MCVCVWELCRGNFARTSEPLLVLRPTVNGITDRITAANYIVSVLIESLVHMADVFTDKTVNLGILIEKLHLQ